MRRVRGGQKEVEEDKGTQRRRRRTGCSERGEEERRKDVGRSIFLILWDCKAKSKNG